VGEASVNDEDNERFTNSINPGSQKTVWICRAVVQKHKPTRIFEGEQKLTRGGKNWQWTCGVRLHILAGHSSYSLRGFQMPDLDKFNFKPTTSNEISERLRDSLTKDSYSLVESNAFKTLLNSSRPGEVKVPDLKITDILKESLPTPPAEQPGQVLPSGRIDTFAGIGAFGGALAIQAKPWVGSALMVGAGGYQFYRDLEHMGSDTIKQRARVALALGADASMVGGGLLTLTKAGPRWLAPALMVGGFAARMAIDIAPERKKK
jgi:hypothetical protein